MHESNIYFVKGSDVKGIIIEYGIRLGFHQMLEYSYEYV